MEADTVPSYAWIPLVTALFVAFSTMITTLATSALLIRHVLDKWDTDKKLETIDSNVNGNLHAVNARLDAALDTIATREIDAAAQTDRTAEHRRMHRGKP